MRRILGVINIEYTEFIAGAVWLCMGECSTMVRVGAGYAGE